MLEHNGISLLDFLKLPEKVRTIEAFEQGLVLETERIDEKTFVLIYLNNFFVEIIFDPQKGNTDITPFKTGYRLEKYIDKICLDKLI